MDNTKFVQNLFDQYNKLTYRRRGGYSRPERPSAIRMIDSIRNRFLDDVVHESIIDVLRALGSARAIAKPDTPMFNDDVETICRSMTGESVRGVRELLTTSKFNDDEIDTWFTRAKDYEEMVECEDGEFAHIDDTFYCDFDDVYYYGESGGHEVYTINGGQWVVQIWGEKPYERHAYECAASGDVFDARYFAKGFDIDGDDVCVEWCSRNEWYHHSSNGDDYWSSEPPDDDDDYDEDSDESDSSIPAYHGAYRSWGMEIEKSCKSLRAFYGFELEVDFGTWDKRHEFYVGPFVKNYGSCEIACAETDGSLDDDTGLEVITRPFPIDVLRMKQNPLRTLVEMMAENGAEDGGIGYGVHITTNWQRLHPQHKSRCIDMVIDNQPMTEYIARRSETDFCPYQKVAERGHHVAVHTRPNNASEVRIFRSTSDYGVLMSYVDYLEAVVDWTLDHQRLFTGPIAKAMFRQFVMSQPEKYPFLARRFSPSIIARAVDQEIAECASQS